MSYLVAIDPGVKKCAIAVFVERKLEDAYYVNANLDSRSGGALNMVKQLEDTEFNDPEIVIERPQIYTGAEAKGDPNDLLDLAFVAGYFRAHRSYLPAEWKGQVPKEIHHKRLSEYFAESGDVDGFDVWKRISKLKKDHDLRDAVGLGLFHLGLVGKGGIGR